MPLTGPEFGNVNPLTEEQFDEWVQRITPQIGQGHEGAFRQFFDAYADRVYRLLLVLTRGQEDLARDLLQQVFIKVARGLPQFEREKKLWGWLSQVARNSFVDHLRRQKAQPLTVELQVHDIEIQQERAAEPELMDALEASVDELAATDRELINACYFEHLAHKELAARERTTPKAIESRLARIRQRLRHAILSKLKSYALF